MSGIKSEIVFGVTQIETTFSDELGAQVLGIGTGFWIRLQSGSDVFITNRHNVDPTLRYGDETKFKLGRIRLLLREKTSDKKNQQIGARAGTQFFEICDSKSKIFAAGNADCAIILPYFDRSTENFGHFVICDKSDLADEDFFQTKLHLMDSASFVGFAGNANSKWWDQKWTLPIARLASVASFPAFPFTHEGIKTGDVLLVSGLSFSGSSGSPLIAHQQSVRPGLGISNPAFVPPKVIGIMSGHWRDNSSDGFEHSGLSYFTRSTSILHLIQANSL